MNIPDLCKQLDGMTLKEANAFLQGNAHLFAMNPEDVHSEFVLNGLKESFEVGFVTLIAVMFYKKNGLDHTVEAAIDLYKQGIKVKESKGEDMAEIRSMIANMDSLVAWSGRCKAYPRVEPVWPIRMPFVKPEKKAGLANIMLFLAAHELGGGENTDLLALHGIKEFLDKQVERSKGRMGK